MIALAALIALACVVIGFFADCMLSSAGFGVIGNGVVAVTGLYLAMWFIERYVSRHYVVNASGAVIFAASMGALLLVGLALFKRRFLVR